jgi:hypothetical protein
MAILKNKFIRKSQKVSMIQIHTWCENFLNQYTVYINLFKHGTKYLTITSFLRNFQELKLIQTYITNKTLMKVSNL